MKVKLHTRLAFQESISRCFPLYLLSILAPIFAFRYGYGLMHRPKGNELLTVFISGRVDDVNYTSKIKDRFSMTGLREVDSISCDPTDPVYIEKLTVAGFISSDIMIVPESILKLVRMDSSCLELTTSIQNAYFGDIDTSYYAIGGVNYGILYKDTDKTFLDDYVTFNSEKQYLFFNATSSNVGEAGQGTEKDTLAFQTARFLFGK